MSDIVRRFMEFVDGSPTAFHGAGNVAERLIASGFTRIEGRERWNLKPGKGYFTCRNGSSVVAFRLPAEEKIAAASIVAVHLDSPALRLKLETAVVKDGLLTAGIDVYGGAIHSSWLDRPLGIGGVIADVTSGSSRRVELPGAALIPNLAIHLNRNVNNGVEINPQTRMTAVLGTSSVEKLYEALGIDDITNCCCDLYLYDSTPAELAGIDKELLLAPRIDNLASAFAALEALIEAPQEQSDIQVVFFADNEEIGSRTPQGADSDFLMTVLQRIILGRGGDMEDLYCFLAKSRLLSLDAAHAFHPGYPECYEPAYAPVLNGGIVLKSNVSYRYCTTSDTAAEITKIWRERGLTVQKFINRADMPCGSTVGPRLSSMLGVPGADAGIPILAMHSARETAGVRDIEQLPEAVKAFLAISR